MEKQRILALGPHTDDIELGCGGTVNRFCSEGHEVHYVTFSLCSKSLPAGLHPNTLEYEAKQAAQQLGVKASNTQMLDFDVRDFPAVRQQILEELIKFRSKINPDLVLLPSRDDLHQDHQVISQEGIRAFKNVSILGYEMPWNNVSFQNQCFYKLTKAHMDQKVKALSEYKSQAHRGYMNESFVLSLATVRAAQIQAEYAEVFEVIRWVN